MVMGGDSCSIGREFESRHHVLDGHCFTYIFVVKCVFGKTKINEKEAGQAHFRKNVIEQKILFLFPLQGNSNGSKTEITEAPQSSSSAEDNQPDPKVESRLRLCRHLPQERLQHPHRLHPVPGKDRRANISRRILYHTKRWTAKESYSVIFKIQEYVICTHSFH